MVSLLLLSSSVWSQSLGESVNKGNEAFAEEDYDLAIDLYNQAQTFSPEDARIYFNKGTALYQQGMYEEALAEYEKALLTDDADLKEKVYYNQGNAFYRVDKYQEAIDEYTEALKINPDDIDAKQNIEFIRRKIKEQMDQQQQNQDQQQEQKKQDQEQQENQDQENNQEKEGDQKQQNQQPEEGGTPTPQPQQSQPEESEEEEKKESPKPQPQQTQKDEISPEDAERILDSMARREKEAKELRDPQIPRGNYRIEKDW